MPSGAFYKLALPDVARQVDRPRLRQALAEHLSRTPLVWLSGLPGAGKTSAAAQWARQALAAGERCLWYRLDEDDADPAALFDALRHHPLHGGAARLPAWSPDNQPELTRFTRRFFSQLPERTDAPPGTDAPLTVVFDDCHRVADTSAFFTLLEGLREVAGPQLRALLISRRAPPPTLARGELAGWLSRVDELGLSADECVALVEHASGQAWPREAALRLQVPNGWMAHVLARARAAATQSPPADLSAAEQVGQYLASEMLLMLPEAQRVAFRRLAELPEIPRSLAAGPQAPVAVALARQLDAWATQQHFVDRTASDAWRLHDLLRDALRQHNEWQDTPDARAEARRQMAGWLADGHPLVAMALLVAASDRDRALTLLDAQGRDWLAQGRHRQLLGWLQALPEGGPARRGLWQAEALLPDAPEAARPLFARARAALADAGDIEGAYRAWGGEVASYVVQWGAVHGLADLVDDLEALQQRLGPPPAHWRLRILADALTALMYGRAEDPRIRRYAEATAAALGEPGDDGDRVIAAAQLLIYRLWWAGDFPGGRALYEAHDAVVDAAGDALPPLARLIWWSNAAIVDWQCGDPARCHDKVARGLALAEASGVHVRDFFLLTQGIFCALSQEDWPRAEAYLARLAVTERRHQRLDSMVHHFFRSWHSLSRGDAATALAHARSALPMAEALGSLFHKVIVLSALAPAALHAGDLDTAQQAYRAQLALAKGSQNPTFAYIAFCAGAEIALVTGDAEGLRKQVERMLTVKHLGGFHSDCGWRTPVRARLFAFALEHRVLPGVARQWIQEKRIAPPDTAAAALDWPMPARVQAIGALRVWVDGRETDADGKPSYRLRALLAALIASRDGVPQAQLCDWLWPDAEGDKAAAALKTCIYRLRGWLGAEAVLVKSGVVALNPHRVACDLWLLQALPDGPQPAAEMLLPGFDLPVVQRLRAQWPQSRQATEPTRRTAD